MQTKFKIGDRVRFINANPLYTTRLNTTAVIENILGTFVVVRFVSDNYTDKFFTYRFKLINDPEKICKITKII